MKLRENKQYCGDTMNKMKQKCDESSRCGAGQTSQIDHINATLTSGNSINNSGNDLDGAINLGKIRGRPGSIVGLYNRFPFNIVEYQTNNATWKMNDTHGSTFGECELIILSGNNILNHDLSGDADLKLQYFFFLPRLGRLGLGR